MPVRRLIQRRSVRTFTSQAVTVETVEEIIESARWTGSARNRQPWRFVAVCDPAVRRALSTLGAYAGHVADAPMVLVLLSPAEQRQDTEFDLGRAAQSITLAAVEQGLGACIVSLYPRENAQAAAELVDAEPDWVARHAIALGHPAAQPRRGRPAIPLGRRETAELLRIL